MPRQVVFKASFWKSFKALGRDDQNLVNESLGKFQNYPLTGQSTVGLGLKLLDRKIYEFRAGLFLRVLYKMSEREIVIGFVGTHDQVLRFLKRQ